jgi:hypothetical protein
MMIDLRAARISAHRANIKRYCRLLATELTETERAFLHRRIAEERLALEQLDQSNYPAEAERGDFLGAHSIAGEAGHQKNNEPSTADSGCHR